MNNGIVLKINRSSVVVMTPDGEYLKCKKIESSYEIGQEVQFPNHSVIVNKKMKLFIPKLLPATIACVLIFMSFFLLDWNKESALAAGLVKVNSEAKVSLVLNKQLEVIDIKAHNKQGKELIKKLGNWKQEAIDHVMDELIVEIEKSKVIMPDDKITLTGDMGKKYKDKQSKLNQKLNGLQQSNTHISVNKPKELQDKQKPASLVTGKETVQANGTPKVNSKIKNNDQKDGSKQSVSKPNQYTKQYCYQGKYEQYEHKCNGYREDKKSNKKNNLNDSNDKNNHSGRGNNSHSNSLNNDYVARGKNHDFEQNKKNEYNQFVKKEQNQTKFNYKRDYQEENRYYNKKEDQNKDENKNHSNNKKSDKNHSKKHDNDRNKKRDDNNSWDRK